MKYIDLNEFVSEGYLQAVNRLVLHPFGLALEVTKGPDGIVTPDSLRVQDHRDDPVGVSYARLDMQKVKKTDSLIWKLYKTRFDTLGYWVQEE